MFNQFDVNFHSKMRPTISEDTVIVRKQVDKKIESNFWWYYSITRDLYALGRLFLIGNTTSVTLLHFVQDKTHFVQDKTQFVQDKCISKQTSLLKGNHISVINCIVNVFQYCQNYCYFWSKTEMHKLKSTRPVINQIKK